MHPAYTTTALTILQYNSPKEELDAAANADKTILAPVVLNLELGNMRLQDSFTWNVNGMLWKSM